MSRSVGLVVITVIDGQKVALLHKRGGFNPEKMKPETWPGASQVSCHGKLRDGEDFKQGLYREAEEELGPLFVRKLEENEDQIILIYEKHTQDKSVKTFAVFMENPAFLKDIRLAGASGGILLADENTELRNLKNFDKKQGVTDNNVVAMFADEIQAVRQALKVVC
jgi:ADP-ribose pyrophosphatase YjhB (NUDIX family)